MLGTDLVALDDETIGLRTPAYREAAIAYVEANRSVKEGINDSFLDPELDAKGAGYHHIQSAIAAQNATSPSGSPTAAGAP